MQAEIQSRMAACFLLDGTVQGVAQPSRPEWFISCYKLVMRRDYNLNKIVMEKKIIAAKSSKTERKVHSSKVSDINLLLSAHSREIVKGLKVVLPPRLLSLLRHSLCGLSNEMQQFVLDNILMYLRTGHMIRFGEPHIDQVQGLILIELMNAKASIHFPPF